MKIDKKIAALIILVLISYTFLLRPQFAARNRIRAGLRRKEQVLEKCFSTEGILPTDAGVNKLRENLAKLERDFESEAGKIFHKPLREDVLPFEREKRPLYFRQTLAATSAELTAEAAKREARIPSSFGFSGNLPSEEEIMPLLNRLGLIRKFILAALDSGVNEITELRFIENVQSLQNPQTGRESARQNTGGEQALERTAGERRNVHRPDAALQAAYPDIDFVEEISFVVRLSCDTESLFRLLYVLQRDYSFYLIHNMQVMRNEDDLTVRIILSALYEKS